MKTKVRLLFTKLLVVFGISLALPVFATAAVGASNQTADAAKNWLTLIDDGKYEQSWNEASKFFQEHVTQAQWARQAKAIRQPLGAILLRSAPVVRFATSLPGVPDGKYAIMQFHSKFAHKAAALETVTMMLQDGTWQPAGYFIR
ncbi:MAG TPA: DUF4019 domain-containing protein [Xanthobacteraceae bacterium]|jgi:hypothetical protein